MPLGLDGQARTNEDERDSLIALTLLSHPVQDALACLLATASATATGRCSSSIVLKEIGILLHFFLQCLKPVEGRYSTFGSPTAHLCFSK